MDLAIIPEREELRSSVRALLEDRSPASKVLLDMETEIGYDPAVWQELVATVGLVGAWAPGRVAELPAGHADQQTVGCFRDLAIVLEELGRSLLCAPFLGTAVLATRALAAVRDEYPPAAEDLRLIATGQLLASVALPDIGQASVVATEGAGGSTLSGRLPLVLDGDCAELLLVPATRGGATALFAVRAASASNTRVQREPLLTMDRTRRFAAVTFDAVPAELVLTGPRADALLSELTLLAAVAIACEQVGGARRCVEMATEYARERKQFGVPIGTFQAVKHTCANMLAALELAQSTAAYAAFCVDDDPVELPLAAHLAKSLCSESFRSISADTIQIHGGIGFTWDHPAHLYFKRAKSSELLLGQPAQHRAQLAELLHL